MRDRLRYLLQPPAIVRRKLLVDGAQGQIAPEDLPAVRLQAVEDRARGRLHAGDGGNAKGEASEKDPEPAQRAHAVAQLPVRESPGDGGHAAHADTDRAAGRGAFQRRPGPLASHIDPAVHHANAPPAQLGQPCFMRDQQQGGAAVTTPCEEMVHHLPAGHGIEVAGRLVGEDEGRTVDQGAGDRHPLLLAPRQLAGVVSQPVRKAHRGELRLRPLMGVGLAGELARRSHVLPSRSWWG